MIMSRHQVADITDELTIGTNMKLYGYTDIEEKEYYGIELDILDCFNDPEEFKANLNDLIKKLEEILNANIFISDPEQMDMICVDIINNKEYLQHHAFIQVVKLQ